MFKSDSFMVPASLLDDMSLLESDQSKHIRSIKESLDDYLPQIESMVNDAKTQSQSASEQVEQLSKIADNLKEQLHFAEMNAKEAKNNAIFANIVSILSVLIAIVSLST